MTNKKILRICLWILVITFIIYVFYLVLIKPHVTGSYTPTIKDCKKAYNCTCIEENCMCTYSKWLIENKLVCSKDIINEKQMKK